MRIYFIQLLVFFTTAVQAAVSESTTLQVYQAFPVSVEVVKYEQPIHISYGKVVSLNGNAKPVWLDSYLKSRNLTQIKYEDWIKLFDKSYTVGGVDLSEKAFDELRERKGDEIGFKVYTILADVVFDVDGTKYIISFCNYDEFLDSSGEALEAKHVGMQFYINRSGTWQLYSPIGAPLWLRAMAKNSFEYVEDVLGKGVLVLESQYSYPSYFDKLNPYSFFLRSDDPGVVHDKGMSEDEGQAKTK